MIYEVVQFSSLIYWVVVRGGGGGWGQFSCPLIDWVDGGLLSSVVP